MSVVIADVVQERIDLAVAQVEAVPGAGKVLGLKVDVGVLEEVEAMKERILKELGAVSGHTPLVVGTMPDLCRENRCTFSCPTLG